MNTPQNTPVLLVDDRPENLTALEALLDDMGLDLVRAPSGNEALRRCLHTDFALVLLDVQMPGMDGFETAELMRDFPRTRQIPIIFITAGMKDEYQMFKGYESGAVDYLVKPLQPAVLRGKVRVFRDVYNQRRELGWIHAELEQQNDKLREAYLQLEQETSQRLQAVQELRQKEQMLLQQNRMAAMGEMLGNIAHQWRQPLNILGLRIQEIGLFFELGHCTPEFLEANIAKSMETLQYLSRTIDDFRGFTVQESAKTLFDVGKVIAKTVSMVRESFTAWGIAIEIEQSGEPKMNGYPNEFSQVLLNLLMNAKDAARELNINNARITLRSWADDDRAVVTVVDNAGGIDPAILEKVFDAYFTTKELGQGTGVGLFMSKVIIEKKMGGRLTASNIGSGAEFKIEV